MAKKIPTTQNQHGITRSDDYAWLRNISDPDLIPMLNEENQKTDEALSHLAPLQENIFKEIVSRVLEDDDEHPYAMGDYEYFYRMQKGKNYASYYRRKKGTTNDELLLDLNQKAEGKKFLSLANYSISPDQTKIAYALDFDGSEHYDLFVQDIASGKIIDESIKAMTGDFEWGDSQTIYYTLMDSTQRPEKVMLHRLGASTTHDHLILHDPNLSYYVEITKSKSDRFVFVTSRSKITTEVSFIDLTKDVNKATLIHPRQDNIKYYVDHHEDRFIIHTNENAENYKLMQTPLDQFEKKNWTALIPYDAEKSCEDIEIFKNYIVIADRYRASQYFRILNCTTNTVTSVEFDEPVYTVSFDHNKVYDTDILRFTYSSLKTPIKTQHVNLKTNQITTVKEKKIPGYNPDFYTTERVLAPSRDGKTMIPISLIYKKDFRKNGQAPLFLYGYGSYGMSRNPSFSASTFSLVDRGFVYAIAHVRGGAECGRTWYNDGKFQKKMNTFYDFIDCAKYLIKENFTAEKKIAICGGSAGGLLMGAVTNLEPELWGAVIALVPFVDVVNTMLDETLPLTVTEYDEWGNPNDKKFFEYMLSYSPYDNITKKSYPPILATGGLHDPRVGYWEPTKWVFKLRENQLSKSPILLKMQMQAGHQGPSGRYEAYREVAFYYSFVIGQLKNDII